MTAVEAVGLSPNEFFRTNDMAMVTFLKLKGNSVQSISFLDDENCYWFFRVTDTLLDYSEDFLAGQTQVEPREYSRIFNETKRELYNARDEHRATSRPR